MSKAELSIAGKRYLLSCAPGQEERLEDLGRLFDSRVRDLANALGDIGPERLFLAAGLSLMDELEWLKADPAGSALMERMRAVETRAASALSEAAARIEAITSRLDRAS